MAISKDTAGATCRANPKYKNDLEGHVVVPNTVAGLRVEEIAQCGHFADSKLITRVDISGD